MNRNIIIENNHDTPEFLGLFTYDHHIWIKVILAEKDIKELIIRSTVYQFYFNEEYLGWINYMHKISMLFFLNKDDGLYVNCCLKLPNYMLLPRKCQVIIF